MKRCRGLRQTPFDSIFNHAFNSPGLRSSSQFRYTENIKCWKYKMKKPSEQYYKLLKVNYKVYTI